MYTKKKIGKYFLCLLTFALMSTTKCDAQNNTSNEPDIEGGGGKEFAFFLNSLKNNLKKNDSLKVANQIFYPLNCAYGKKTGAIEVNDKKKFLNLYHLLFDERMRNFILSQNEDSVFSNYKGIMLGVGQIWIRQKLDKSGKLITKICTVNNSAEIWHNQRK